MHNLMETCILVIYISCVILILIQVKKYVWVVLIKVLFSLLKTWRHFLAKKENFV